MTESPRNPYQIIENSRKHLGFPGAITGSACERGWEKEATKYGYDLSIVSMDWWKGKLKPESPIFHGKINGFL